MVRKLAADNDECFDWGVPVGGEMEVDLDCVRSELGGDGEEDDGEDYVVEEEITVVEEIDAAEEDVVEGKVVEWEDAE